MRRFWNEEKNKWCFDHILINKKDAYKVFVKLFDCEDLKFENFVRHFSIIGAVRKKNRRSENLLPLYSERVHNGKPQIKVAMPNTWIPLGRWIYEETHPGYLFEKTDRFIFLDGDKTNRNPENIVLMKMKEQTIFLQFGGVVKGNPELTKMHLLLARLKLARLDRGERDGLVKVYRRENGKGHGRYFPAEKLLEDRARRTGMSRAEWFEYMRTHTVAERMEISRQLKEKEENRRLERESSRKKNA